MTSHRAGPREICDRREQAPPPAGIFGHFGGFAAAGKYRLRKFS
jgi:hypothetical protein